MLENLKNLESEEANLVCISPKPNIAIQEKEACKGRGSGIEEGRSISKDTGEGGAAEPKAEGADEAEAREKRAYRP